MHRSLFSLALALTISSNFTITSAGVLGVSPRDVGYGLDKRLLCVGDSFNEIFMSVGMGVANNGAQADITSFCYSWIDIPSVTSYIQTITPTSTLFPATVTVESTTEVVLSATSTVTVTTSQIEYALYKRSHVRKDKIQGRAAAAAPVVTPRAELSKRMLMKARQAASSATRTLDVSSLGDALSSACSCKMIPPLTTFLTSSASAVTRTIGATDYRTVTVNNTLAGGVTTITETLNVTSTIRPTGTGSGSYGTAPMQSRNYTISGTGTGIGTGTGTGPTYTRSSNNTRTWRPTRSHGTGYSRGTGTSGWPYPTKNSTSLPCSTGYTNSTATVTALSTATVLSTTTEVQSYVFYKNQTVTVTESSATVNGSGTTVTITGATQIITKPGSTVILPASTITEDKTTIMETLPATTVTLTEPGETETETETVTEAAETETETITVTATQAGSDSD